MGKKTKKKSLNSPFRLLLTGTPGTGKTELARALGAKLHARVLAEKTFARKQGIGKKDTQTGEMVVDISKLKKSINRELANITGPVIIEGHLSCETKLRVDRVVVLTCPRGVLEKRLRARRYSELKIEENLFCEEEKYCFQEAKKHYPRIPLLVLPTNRPKKVIRDTVLNWIHHPV